MSDIPSSFTKVNDIEVASDAPLTEALHFKYGGNDNFLFDELALQDARITELETPNVNQSTVTGALTSLPGVGVLKSITITPKTSNVLVVPTGSFIAPAGTGAQIQIRRNGAQLYLYFLNSDTSFALSSIVDTGATAGASNTYDIYISSQSGLPVYSSASIGVIDIK